MKVSELNGVALDWAVAKCEGENSVAACYYADNTPLWLDESPEPEWKPSTNWAQGGPIIEREGIALGQTADGWEATCDGAVYVYGKTPLIAAMRCYAINNLGKEVEVPNGL